MEEEVAEHTSPSEFTPILVRTESNGTIQASVDEQGRTCSVTGLCHSYAQVQANQVSDTYHGCHHLPPCHSGKVDIKA